MEVHAHTHTARKKWTHYFWEFLMLFLAVFCGFLAEYQLEHKIERDRAKELAVSLYKDLQNDTAALNNISRFRTDKEIKLDSFFRILQQNPDKINAPDFFRFIIPAFSTNSFSERQSTGTITQLKNAGYLRYFTHTAIPRALAVYESSINSLSEMEKTEAQEISDKGYTFLREKIDPGLFNTGYSQKSIPENAQVIPTGKNDFRLLYGNCVVIGILNRNINRGFIANCKMTAITLMELLKREYQLK